ncbi:putative transcriptional regulatory protein pdtaR (plasmid) [Sulfitobacter indolifex]|uniref:Response regulator receiver protein n=1 Tax=Sulfitobacter indolifex HEL-45 TaxID=391624 RepID=A0ABM9X0C2_9RHOB|nr:response regulator [Sulfitobacter indolifex]EDQ02913.1 Response regulator receiver protein [Sulfitobacter indolifex HEL-45]UOA20579.1 putative transcriptional regulatory protein pdtaR [Sulfitobacter indolifex]UOA20852.1 putative transcriptional regulatory protein pdtaR [Sulfitobacter indolifex]
MRAQEHERESRGVTSEWHSVATSPENGAAHPALAGGPETAAAGETQNALQNDVIALPQPLRVLIVEDEAIIAMEIEMILEDFGAEVVGTVMSAQEAVDYAKLHRPDCITMDINLKGDRDGVSAALEIHEAIGIRAIFISAYGSDDLKLRAQSAQPFGWIQKPIRTGELKEALVRVRETL